MSSMTARPLALVVSCVAALTSALTAGCASGGFKLTRTYAQFVNKQSVVIRVVLYILTGVVFAVTLLVDMVALNTMDFWEGRVSAGDYQFKDGERTYHARHETLPGSSRKRSTVEVFGPDKALLQTVVLQETSEGEIELKVDGRTRARVRDLKSLPTMASYDETGAWLGDQVVPLATSPALVASRR